MKKIYILGIIIAMFIFYGCSRNNFNVSDLEKSTIVVNNDNINAIIEEDIIKSSKEDITVVLENKTEYEYFYGTYFNLEVELDNNWYKVPFDKSVDFKDIGVMLKGNDENKEVIKLSKYFNSLPEGKYRIVKSLYLDGKEIVVVAPFEIYPNDISIKNK